jgi:transposase-like protein
MSHHLKRSFKFVRRPDGTLLTPGNLPPTNLRRWVIRYKADIVMAVGGGILTLEEACARYGLSREEFRSWQDAFQRFGKRGLSSRGLLHMHRLKTNARVPDAIAETPTSTEQRGATSAPPQQYRRA